MARGVWYQSHPFSLSAHRMGGEGRDEVGAFYKLFLVFFTCFLAQSSFGVTASILNPSDFAHYIIQFNSMEDENVTNFISNSKSSVIIFS